MGASGPAPTAYTVMLTAMCLLLLAFVLLRLAYALRRRHKLLAWSTGFHALCLLWTVVRSAYWIAMLAQADMSYLALYLLYWFPTPIQFANFSLLILFYLQVITGDDWRRRWRSVCLPLYFLLTVSMATFTAVWAFNSSYDISDAERHGDEYDEEFSQITAVRVQLLYSAGSFLLLSVLFGLFAWKMATVESWKQRRLLISQPKRLVAINAVLSAIFLTRAARDLATSQSWFLSIWNQLDLNGRVTSCAYFVFFCFWEFLPTVLLLCLISSKAGGVGAPWHEPSSRPRLPDFGLFHIINTGADSGTGIGGEGAGLLAASPMTSSSYGTMSSVGAGTASRLDLERARWTHGGDLFQDPSRYDSDDGAGQSPRLPLDSFGHVGGADSARSAVETPLRRILFEAKSPTQ